MGEERRKRREVEIEFAPEDLALATVPGADFDPSARAFDMEELRPQPIIRKRVKHQEHNCCKKVPRGEEAEGKPDCFEGGFLGERECQSEERCRGGKRCSCPAKDGGGNSEGEDGQV